MTLKNREGYLASWYSLPKHLKCGKNKPSMAAWSFPSTALHGGSSATSAPCNMLGYFSLMYTGQLHTDYQCSHKLKEKVPEKLQAMLCHLRWFLTAYSKAHVLWGGQNLTASLMMTTQSQWHTSLQKSYFLLNEISSDVTKKDSTPLKILQQEWEEWLKIT